MFDDYKRLWEREYHFLSNNRAYLAKGVDLVSPSTSFPEESVHSERLIR